MGQAIGGALPFAVGIALSPIATVGPAVPVALHLALGERSRRPLEDIRAWMVQNNATIMAVICLLLAAKLIGDGISGF